MLFYPLCVLPSLLRLSQAVDAGDRGPYSTQLQLVKALCTELSRFQDKTPFKAVRGWMGMYPADFERGDAVQVNPTTRDVVGGSSGPSGVRSEGLAGAVQVPVVSGLTLTPDRGA